MTEWNIPYRNFSDNNLSSGFMYQNFSSKDSKEPWSTTEFEKRLRMLGKGYHTVHPFQKAMVEGKLTKKQMQGWICNRFYYQLMIPRKDGAILSNCPDRDVRKLWVKRILEQDGFKTEPGGIEDWIELGVAAGISREELLSLNQLAPSVRFSVDAYLNFVKNTTWQEGICSSLTEIFAPSAHESRLEAFPKYYPWIKTKGLAYFNRRILECPIDVEHGLRVTMTYFNTHELQVRALNILKYKLDVLWSILDGIQVKYGIGQ